MNKNNQENQGPKITRAKLPKENELIGTIQKRLGGNKMMVSCSDNIERNCRVPGRLKRRLWLRPGDIILIQPWELDNTKGDILFKYPSSQILWLKKNGYLKEKEEEF